MPNSCHFIISHLQCVLFVVDILLEAVQLINRGKQLDAHMIS